MRARVCYRDAQGSNRRAELEVELEIGIKRFGVMFLLRGRQCG